jgi:hypothetical protein
MPASAAAPVERPVIFSGPMVRAILAGEKTQTRRIVKPQPVEMPEEKTGGVTIMPALMWDKGGAYARAVAKYAAAHPGEHVNPPPYGVNIAIPFGVHYDNPYGRPGDRLWVRETWRVASINHGLKNAQFWTIQFREGFGVLPHPQPPRHLFGPLTSRTVLHDGETGNSFGPWRTPIHLPRWASRLTLEVTGVRVQRLQEIRCYDIRAEGVSCPEHDFPGGFCTSECAYLRQAWAEAWNRINGNRAPFESNPWVWGIEFKVAEARS